jgi:hypothetical protein
VTQLAESSQVSKTEVAAKQAEVEIARARMQQAVRAADHRKLLVDLARLEFEQAEEANKKAPGAISQTELRRLSIMVQLAEAKYAELAE